MSCALSSPTPGKPTAFVQRGRAASGPNKDKINWAWNVFSNNTRTAVSQISRRQRVMQTETQGIIWLVLHVECVCVGVCGCVWMNVCETLRTLTDHLLLGVFGP